MLGFNPSGKVMMDFCLNNLTAHKGEVRLRDGVGDIEEQHFNLVKERVRGLVDEVLVSMFHLEKFDIDAILNRTSVSKNDLWDRALVYSIVRSVANVFEARVISDSANEVGRVLSRYLSLIRAEQNTSMEVLDLKLQRERLKCAYDLDFTAERYRRRKLQS